MSDKELVSNVRKVFKPSWKNYSIFIVLGILFIRSVFGIILIVLAIFYKNRRKYLVETNRVACKEGVFSTKVTSINISDIETIKIKQDRLQKIFRTGNVVITSKQGPVVDFKGINNPIQIEQMVKELIDQ